MVEVGSANVTPAAEEVLVRQGIEVVPDILASGASDLASALEWREARLEPEFRKDDLDAYIRKQMTLAARRVRVARARYECDLRTAATCSALERIGKIYEIRGVFP
jgi:glutamate dehydrogenase (NAD(P)+)